MTLLGTLARRYTLRAKVGSDAFTRSPSSSEHSNYDTNRIPYNGGLTRITAAAATSWSSRPTLSSFSHFSSSCLRPCCSTGLHSSKDSNLLSWPWSSRIPKYCNNGEAWPGWAGTLWNLRIVSAVRKIPWGWKRWKENSVGFRQQNYNLYLPKCALW